MTVSSGFPGHDCRGQGPVDGVRSAYDWVIGPNGRRASSLSRRFSFSALAIASCVGLAPGAGAERKCCSFCFSLLALWSPRAPPLSDGAAIIAARAPAQGGALQECTLAPRPAPGGRRSNDAIERAPSYCPCAAFLQLDAASVAPASTRDGRGDRGWLVFRPTRFPLSRLRSSVTAARSAPGGALCRRSWCVVRRPLRPRRADRGGRRVVRPLRIAERPEPHVSRGHRRRHRQPALAPQQAFLRPMRESAQRVARQSG